MQSDKLVLVTALVEVVVGSILLFTGSALLYAALYGIVFHYGTVQVIPALTTWGAILTVLGIITAWDAARKLKVTHLVIIAVADLFGAFVFIFPILSPSPDSVSAWLTITGLNNILLDTALVAGHMKKQSSKVGFENKPNIQP